MFQIDSLSRIPVYEQLTRQLESFLLSGAVRPGEQLPSVRSVATEHSINPRTILRAYSELDARGLITAVPGKGYFVCRNALSVLRVAQTAKLEDLRSMLRTMVLAGVDKEEILACVEQAYTSQQAAQAERKE